MRGSNSQTKSARTLTSRSTELLTVYHAEDHLLITSISRRVNEATMKLAENMMNTAVSGALKGTHL